MSQIGAVNPKNRVTTKTYKAALRVLNKVQKHFGMKVTKTIPNGVPEDGTACPLANVFKSVNQNDVNNATDIVLEVMYPGTKVEVEVPLEEFLSPKEIRILDDFIQEFDANQVQINKEEKEFAR